MPNTMLETTKKKYQTLADFIKSLSKKDYSKCNKIAEKIQFALANQAKTCIQHLSTIDTLAKKKNQSFQEIKSLKEAIKNLNQDIETLKKLKGIKLTQHQKQLNDNMSILDLLKKGCYVQANRSSKNPLKFIEELIEYRQLKMILQNNQNIQFRGYLYGGEEYTKIRQMILKRNQNDSELGKQFCEYLAKIDGIDNEEEWRKPKLIQFQLFQAMKKKQYAFRKLIKENRQLRDRNQFQQYEENQIIQPFDQLLYEKIKDASQLIDSRNAKKTPEQQMNQIIGFISERKWKNTQLKETRKMSEEEIATQFIIESLELRIKQLQKFQRESKEKLLNINYKLFALIVNSSIKGFQADEGDTSQMYSIIQENIDTAINQAKLKEERLDFITKQRDSFKNQFNRLKLVENITEQYGSNLQLLQRRSSQGQTSEDLQFRIAELQHSLNKEEVKNKQLGAQLKLQAQENQKLLQQRKRVQEQMKELKGQLQLHDKERNRLKQTMKKQMVSYKKLEHEQSFIRSRTFSRNLSQENNDSNSLQRLEEENSILGSSIKQQQKIELTKYNELKHEFDELSTQNAKLNEQIRKLNDGITKANKEKSDYIMKLEKAAKQKDELVKKIEKQRETCSSQIEQIEKLNDMLHQMDTLKPVDKGQSKILPEAASILSQVIKNSHILPIQSELQQMKKQYQLVRKQVEKRKERIKKLQKDNLTYLNETKVMKDKVRKLQANQTLLKDEIEKRQRRLEQKDQQIKDKQKLIQQLQLAKPQPLQRYKKQQKREQQEKYIQPLHLKQNHRCISHLFTAGEVFEEGEDERLHLIRVLEQQIGPIHRTKLLYAFDPLNKVNFHRYIDNHAHLLVVAKTALGKHIAAYSESQLSADGGFRGMGLLMPLWDLNSVFHLIPGKKSVSYDDYFLIYGNSELRIRSQECKVFSNFGIANSYFDNQRKRVEHFLGEGQQRQVDLETYQVYEITFVRDTY